VVTDALLSHYKNVDNTYENILKFIQDISDNQEITFDKDVWFSEYRHGHRNIALANLMKSFNNLENNVDDVLVTTSGCIGICSREPLATIEEQGKEPIVYEYLTQNKARQIFKRHVLNGEIQNEFVLARGREQEEKGESK
jgi:glutaminase